MPDGKVISINREPSRFVADTQHLSCLEIGAYNAICDNIVILGQDESPPSLPDDDLFLANIAKLSVKAWRHMKPRLCTGQLAVLVIEEGRISQPRVVEEIENAKHRIATSSRGGVASGESRRKKADVLRERMLNSTSKSSSTPLRSPVELHYEPKANSERTSHESRVTKYDSLTEPTILRIASSSLHDALRADDAASKPRQFITPLLATVAPRMKAPSDATVRAWLDIAPDIWSVAAVVIEKGEYLERATAGKYLTQTLAEKRGNGGFQPDARGYVLMMTDPDRPVIRKLREAASKTTAPMIEEFIAGGTQ